MIASQNGHTETAAKLIAAGAKLDVQTKVCEGGRARSSCCSSMCVCLCCVCACACVCMRARVHLRVYAFSQPDTCLVRVRNWVEIERCSRVPAFVCPYAREASYVICTHICIDIHLLKRALEAVRPYILHVYMYMFIHKNLYLSLVVFAQHVVVSTLFGTHPRGARLSSSAPFCAAQNLDINVFVRLATPRTHPFSSASLCAVQSGHTAFDIAKDKGHTAIEALLRHKGAKVKSEL